MLAFVFSVLALGVTPQSGLLQKRHNGLGSASTSAGTHALTTALEFKHRLRVCNAYPYAAPLGVQRGSEMLTDEPMAYKSCQDFKINLHSGDKLEFKVGDANAGTFSVSDLPNSDALLLLVVYRHDAVSTAVSFESHVYANLLNAQVAIIDTYKGTEKAAIKIEDHEDAKLSRTEDLRFDSVVAVNQGKYDVGLYTEQNEALDTASLIALNRESYVVVRVGVQAQQGPSYPMELVVFPESDEASLHGSACFAALSLMLFALW